MKILPHVVLFLFLFSSNLVFAQDPTATVTSSDKSFCESGDATLTVQFTGVPPYNFLYELDGSYQLGSATQNIYSETYDLVISNITSSADINVVRVYDNIKQCDTGNPLNSGAVVSNQVMHVHIDQMPSPNAGTDKIIENNNGICGYEYQLQGIVSDEVNHDISWNLLSGEGTYDDITSPTPIFTKTSEGRLSFILTEQNGACIATDDVVVDFLGSPTAAIVSGGEYKFCSTDGIEDNASFTIKFSGNAPFDYTINSDAEKTSAVSDYAVEYPVSTTQTLALTKVTDVYGCEASSISGEQVVTDLKPNTFAGDNDVACGKDFALEATASVGATGVWSTITPGVSFGDGQEINPNAVVTSADFQVANLTWTETSNEMSCVSSAEVTIRFAEPPALLLNDTEDVICEGSSTILNYEVSGNEPLVVDYNDGVNLFTEGGLTEGNKTLELSPEFNTGSNLQSLTEYKFSRITGTYGCEASYSDVVYNVYIDKMPSPNAGIDLVDLCEREIMLDAEPSIGVGNWEPDMDGEFLDSADPYTTFTAYESKIYNLKWVETNGQCSSIDEVSLEVLPSPFPVEAGRDTTIYAMDNMQLYATPLTEGTGVWSLLEGEANIENPEDPKSVVSGMKPGLYRFLWSATPTEGNCDPETKEVEITMRELFQTSGFSPNGDALNETFKILGAENLTNTKLTVFDRYGKEVYSVKNYQNNWNGIDKGGSKLTQGVYYYIFDADELSEPVKKYLVIKY